MAKDTDISTNRKWSIEVYSDPTNLEDLRLIWDEITETQAPYKPFLSFDWFRLWQDHFLGENQLLILILYEHKKPMAIAPLYLKREKYKGVPVRKVEFLGNIYSPIQKFLIKEMPDEKREKCVSLIIDYFSNIFKLWDIIDLKAIPDEDESFKTLSHIVRRSVFTSKEYLCFENWYTDDIKYSSEDYFKNRSRNLRASLKKNYKSIKKSGHFEFKIMTSPSDIDKYMPMYFDVYSRSWKKRERVGPEFYMDVTKEFSQKGWLRLGIVYIDSIPVAVGFALICDGFAYFEKTAYDERYKFLGAGSIWLAEMIKYVIDLDKVTVIDVLRGNDEYKKRWFENKRERKEILIFNNNLKGIFLSMLIKHILPLFDKNEQLRAVKAFISKNFFNSDSQ